MKCITLLITKVQTLFQTKSFSKVTFSFLQVLMNPVHKDLKDFIVLRMGAFHTSCIFIAVIGKRFHDAGLRDWIIESDLLGIFLG